MTVDKLNYGIIKGIPTRFHVAEMSRHCRSLPTHPVQF